MQASAGHCCSYAGHQGRLHGRHEPVQSEALVEDGLRAAASNPVCWCDLVHIHLVLPHYCLTR